ncbi:MAG: hypothetical protein ACP5D6_09005 [Kosmotogaceae bacterium]
MKSKNNYKYRYISKFIGGVLLVLLLLNLATSHDIENTFYRLLFILSTLLVAKLLDGPDNKGKLILNWKHFFALALIITSLTLTIFFESQFFAWIFLITFFAFLLHYSRQFKNHSIFIKVFIPINLSVFAGIVPVIINQMLIRFSDEEFYAAVMMVAFSILWLLLYFVYIYSIEDAEVFPFLKIKKSISLKETTLLWGLWGLVLILFFTAIKSYQNSFFPKDLAPLYPGITTETPFICGTTDANESKKGSDGKAVQDTFAALLASKEILTTNDYAFLAIYEQNAVYAQSYKEKLLLEAENNNYTEPANSVKYDQYLASQTIYFFEEIKKSFPELFNEREIDFIENWIKLINKRALTVELVDIFYGLAFSQKPVGAYQNQAIGAGLYAQLLNANISNDLNFKQNKAYLNQSNFGWDRGFRVLDDSINYQPVWITNAYLYELYSGSESNLNQRLSFEWMLNQALPDGSLMSYNFPFKISLGPVSLLGANMLHDGRFLWLTEQAMKNVEDNNYFYPQVGTEVPINENVYVEMPTVGSCLLYGSSGLPGNEGPLAPDKIVFRDGWEDDDLYILLNLRFTGWHRYKSTNAIVLVYAGQELVKEQYTQNLIPWLPVGRAMVRDKRIPIEQLNTLLIPRVGLDAVLNTLIDWFGPYAQDPPFYSDVEIFETSDEYDHTRITLKDWHDWQFNRSIFFYHDGPVFILDNAESKKQKKAVVNFHLADGYTLNENRGINPDTKVDFLFINQENGKLLTKKEAGSLLVQYQSDELGRLNLLTILLPAEWKNGEFVSYKNGIVTLNLAGQSIEFSLTQ